MRSALLLSGLLPLLLGGCGGEKKESVGEVKHAEEKQEVKEEAKPEEPVAETKPKLEGVNQNELERREGIMYLKGSDTPYTGKVFNLYTNGQKEEEGNIKDGKLDGLQLKWRKNGQKEAEGNWMNGKMDGLQLKWHKNGQKDTEVNYKDGEKDGLETSWYENGQKRSEGNYKDGKIISYKTWDSKGQPVDSLEEAEAE